MNFFWVNLGTSYQEVLDNKFLWAPQFTRNEKGTKVKNKGWTSFSNVKKGDVIFGYLDGRIFCIAIAKGDVYEASRPDSRKFVKWDDEGWQADIDLEVIPYPIDVNLFKNFFIENYNEFCMPKVFTVKRQCAQFYMSALPKAAGALILEYIQDTDYVLKVVNSSDKKLPKTEREAIVKARVGQGPYRTSVLDLWGGKCAATGLEYKELLIASHIIPWSLCDDSDRINPHNGFPLSPNIDKLFDKGLISFTNEGELLIKKNVTDEHLRMLGLPRSLKIKNLKPENLKFLAKHRELYKF